MQQPPTARSTPAAVPPTVPASTRTPSQPLFNAPAPAALPPLVQPAQATPAATPAQQAIANFNQTPAGPAVKMKGGQLKPTANPSQANSTNASNAAQNGGQDAQEINRGNDLVPGDNDETSIAENATKFFQNVKVTSGLGVAFFVLIFLIWLTIPTASGYTRLQLLWFTIIGQTNMVEPDTSSSQNKQPNPELSIPTNTSTATPTSPFLSSSGPEQSNGHVSQSAIPDLSGLDLYF